MILLCFGILGGQAQVTPDTYERHYFHYEHDSAAIALSNQLRQSFERSQPIEPGLYLESAILWRWIDSTHQADSLYALWESNRPSGSLAGRARANELLYQALQLSEDQNWDGAVDSLTQSLSARLLQNKMDSCLLADTYGIMARYNKLLADLVESRKYFQLSIQLNNQLERPRALVNDLTDLSEVQMGIDLQDSLIDQNLQRVIDLSTQLHEPLWVAAGYNQLGALSSRRRNHRRALEYFRRTLAIKLEHKETTDPNLDVAWNNIAFQYNALGNADSTIANFERALSYAAQMNKDLAPYHTNLGIVYARNNDFIPAIDHIQKAIAQIDTLVDPNDWYDNPKNLIQSPDLAEVIGVKANALYRFGRQNADSSQLKLALETGLFGLNMMDTLRFLHSYESKNLFTVNMRDYYLIGLRIALELYHITNKKVYLEEAFSLSGRNKSAILNEFIRENQARKALGQDVPWIREEDSLKMAKSRLESQRAALEDSLFNQPELDQLNQQIIELEEEMRLLSIRIKRDNPEYYQMVYNRQGVSSPVLQQLLAPNQSLIEYTIDADTLIIFVLNQSGLSCEKRILQDGFQDCVNQFLNNLMPPSTNQKCQLFTQAAHQLYQDLFAPIVNRITGDHIICIPDNQIGVIPIEALLADTTGYTRADFRRLSYLNNQYTISYLYAQEQLANQSPAGVANTFSRVFGFAPFVKSGYSDATGDFPVLPYTGQELEFMTTLYPGKALVDGMATESQFRKVLQERAILHITSHAMLDKVDPMESRLLFSPDEPDHEFYFFELLSVNIDAPLVVLNACNTGTGTIRPGEGVFSMARGFQYAGVPSMITTLWQVEDRSATTIMNQFYQNLQEGQPRSVALQQSKSVYLKEADAAKASPFYWAGQILLGEEGPLLYQASFSWIIWVTGSILLIIGLLILIKKILVLQSEKRRRSLL